MRRSIFLSTVFGLFATVSGAEPTGGQLVAGEGSIDQSVPGQTTIHQSSDAAIFEFNTLNLTTEETLTFNQPSVDAVTLNRVVGGQGPSFINGTVTAPGNVFFVNRDGIVFGNGARIDVGSLIATTHDIRNEDFMARRFTFGIPGNRSAAIINDAGSEITINRPDGILGFVAPGVANDGVIVADLGRVALGSSGEGFSVDLAGDGFVNLVIGDYELGQVIDPRSNKPMSALVSNNGTIQANGGLVALSAAQSSALVDHVVSNGGLIEANTVAERGGKIILGGGGGSMAQPTQAASTTKVSGTVRAQGADKNEVGGNIYALGETVTVAEATLDASGQVGGGNVWIGGEYLGGNADVAALAEFGIDRSEVRLPTSTYTYVDATSIIKADAIAQGDGGQIIAWADKNAWIGGDISARGGLSFGDGGFIETSGKANLFTFGNRDVSAANGKGGTWLLDPGNIDVRDRDGATGCAPHCLPANGSFTAPEDTTVYSEDIEAVLNNGGNVTLLTNGINDAWTSQPGNGRIIIWSDILKSSGGDASLRLIAGNGITIKKTGSIRSTSGELDVRFSSNFQNGDDVGIIIVERDNDDPTRIAIDTNGGNWNGGGSDIQIYGRVVTQGGNVFITGTSHDGSQFWISSGDLPGDDVQTIDAGSGNVIIVTSAPNSVMTLRDDAIRSTGNIVLGAETLRVLSSSRDNGIPEIFIDDPSKVNLNNVTTVQNQPHIQTISGTPSPAPTDTAPTIGTVTDQTNNVDDILTNASPVRINVSDDNTLSSSDITVTGLPPGLAYTFSSATGDIRIVGKPNTAGTYTVTITVNDGVNGVVTRTFTWVINPTGTPPTPTDTPPTIGTVANQTSTVGDIITNGSPVRITVSDDNALSSSNVTVSGLPPGLGSTFSSATGDIRIVGSPTTAGTYTVTITVNDGVNGAVTRTFTWVVNAAPTPPSPTDNPPTIGTVGNQTNVVGDSLTVSTGLTVNVSDDNGTNNVTVGVSGLPNGLSHTFNSTSGDIRIVGSPTTAGTFTVTITVDDGTNTPTTRTFTWVVNAAPTPPTPTDNPPTTGAGTLTTQSGTEGDALTGYTTPTDAFADDNGVGNLDLTASGAPSGVTFSDNGNGTGTFAGTPNQTGTFTVTITATDAGGNTTTRSFTMVIAAAPTPPTPPTDNPPVVTGSVDGNHQGITVGDNVSVSITVSDESNTGDIVSVSGLPDGIVLTTQGDQVIIAGRPSDAGFHTVALTVSDGTNTPVIQTFNIGVSDSIPGMQGVTQGESVNVILTPDMFTTGTFDGGTAQNQIIIEGGLPDGLTATQLTGGRMLITGTPTGAGYSTINFNLSTSDLTGQHQSSFELGVATPLPGTADTFGQVNTQFNTVTITRDIFNDDVSASTNQAGGGGITISGLPAGLSIVRNGDGTINIVGTPQRAGTSTVTLNYVDANGQVIGTKTFRVQIAAVVVISAQPEVSVDSGFVTSAELDIIFVERPFLREGYILANEALFGRRNPTTVLEQQVAMTVARSYEYEKLRNNQRQSQGGGSIDALRYPDDAGNMVTWDELRSDEKANFILRNRVISVVPGLNAAFDRADQSSERVSNLFENEGYTLGTITQASGDVIGSSLLGLGDIGYEGVKIITPVGDVIDIKDCVENPSIEGCGFAAVALLIPGDDFAKPFVRGSGDDVARQGEKVSYEIDFDNPYPRNIDAIRLTASEKAGILREASELVGNKTLQGSSTRLEARELGESWVGPGYTVASDGTTLVSADGRRTYRQPSEKPESDFSTTGVQVNFENREFIDGKWQIASNAHLDIID